MDECMHGYHDIVGVKREQYKMHIYSCVYILGSLEFWTCEVMCTHNTD